MALPVHWKFAGQEGTNHSIKVAMKFCVKDNLK